MPPRPRYSRYLIPLDFPYRAEIIASLAVTGLLAHLLLAQLTLPLAVAFYWISRASRWRPQWLAGPAVAGLVWALGIGPARAVAGLVAGPRQVLGYIAGVSGHPWHLLHPLGAFSGLTHWLPRQLPLALVLAAAEAGAAWWLYRLHAGDEFPPPRPGLIVAARRRLAAADISSGGVVTRDGGCLGVDAATGRRAAISWREAEGGVLCTGQAEPELTETGFLMAQAAVRRRKPVIAIDLTGSAWLARALAAACTAAGAPLWRFGERGPGYYEPLRGGDPARAAGLVMGMIDWTGGTDQHRQACAGYLATALAVLAAAPGDPRVAVLDELIGLLGPDALAERLRQVPGYHPQRAVLAERVGVAAGQLRADPAAVSAPATQLRRLRGSALGRWLCPPPAPDDARISIGQTVRDRAVTLFTLDRGAQGRSADMIGSLALLDLTTVCGELRGMSVPGDIFAWINGCEFLDSGALAELIDCGPGSGTAVLLTTASAAAADRLVAEANAVVVRGPADPALAERLAGPAAAAVPAGLAGTAGAPAAAGTSADRAGTAARHPLRSQDGIPEGALLALPRDAFALLVRAPRRRVVPMCRHVPAGLAGPPGRPP
jgi:hypothetical protein